MFICPKCNIPLVKIAEYPGVFWRCSSCNGRAATVAFLRRDIPKDIVNGLWQAARSGLHPRNRECPACKHLMAEVPACGEDGKEHLDVCTLCQFVWFDPQEYESLPAIPRVVTIGEPLPEKAREKLAVLEIDAIRERYRDASLGEDSPDAWWQWIPGILGMPVEHDAEPIQQSPWLTWSLALFVSIVSLLALPDLENVAKEFGLIPAQLGRYGGLTFLTSFFLHGGLIHLIGNMYFFLVFGDNVEDWLGRWRFFLLLAGSTLMGGVFHVLGESASTIPCIGASGGISGIIAFYALQFPQVRMGLMFRIYYWVRWVRMPAYAMFILWLLMQFFGTWAQISGFSQVSSLAHLGGAATGLVFWWLSRDGKGEGWRGKA